MGFRNGLPSLTRRASQAGWIANFASAIRRPGPESQHPFKKHIVRGHIIDTKWKEGGWGELGALWRERAGGGSLWEVLETSERVGMGTAGRPPVRDLDKWCCF